MMTNKRLPLCLYALKLWTGTALFCRENSMVNKSLKRSYESLLYGIVVARKFWGKVRAIICVIYGQLRLSGRQFDLEKTVFTFGHCTGCAFL